MDCECRFERCPFRVFESWRSGQILCDTLASLFVGRRQAERLRIRLSTLSAGISGVSAASLGHSGTLLSGRDGIG